MKKYRTWITELAPSWLLGEVGDKLIQAISITVDLCVETLVEALYARFLHSSEFPPDALKLIGSERMMPRYGDESDESYMARLKLAWTSWTFAGTDQAVLEQLAAAGLPGAELWENWMWNWDDAEHPTDWWLQPDADWSRFWVVIKDHPWQGPLWGFFTLGDGTTYGGGMTPDTQTGLRNLVRQWKAGHTRCDYIIVVHDKDEWNTKAPPNGTWGDETNRPVRSAYIPG